MKTIHENPSINDEISFELETIQDVKNLNEIKIYFLEKNSLNCKNIHEVSYDVDSVNQTNFSLLNVEKFKDKIVSSEMNLVYNSKNALINKNNNIFEFTWKGSNNLPGDYVIYWDWIFEDKIYSKSIKFNLINELNFPKPFNDEYNTLGKYETLVNIYTPRAFKFLLTSQDATPMIIDFLNKGVAKELAFIENNLNEIQEIYNINNASSQILKLFSNFLGKSLRTDENNLWKRQVKGSIPLFKLKGTKLGLEKALEECDIKLKKITKLWQVVSQYYHTESFIVNDNKFFLLSFTPLEDIEIYLKKDKKYILNKEIEYSLLESQEYPGKIILSFNENLDAKYIKIIYNYREVPIERKNIENYIKSLPLNDARNEEDQEYPLKNWNVKLLEEDDPLFDIIINEKNPFYDPIIYGKVRTTFLYSENVYNMDSYNGSLRNSYYPCDIDKDFMDSCSYGPSSKLNLDIEIKDLSSYKIDEAKKIIKDFIPFHCSLNNLNIYGLNKEKITNIKEKIEWKIEKANIITDKSRFNDYIIYIIETNGILGEVTQIPKE